MRRNPFKLAAIKSGERTFFDGSVCKNGHISRRKTLNSECCECARIGSNRRSKIYVKKNSEKVKDKAKIYREKNKAILSEKGKLWRQKNKQRCYEAAKKWMLKNPEKFKKNQKKYADKNKQKARVNASIRRTSKARNGGYYTMIDICIMYADQSGKCAYCSDSLFGIYHIDHMVPVCRGGSSYPINLQLLCPKCNRKKGRNTDEEYRWLMAR